MTNDFDIEEDKLPLDEITKTPLVNLSYAYELWNELTKLLRSHLVIKNKLAIDRRREITKTLLDIYSSPKGRLVAALIWDLKATTTKELMNLTSFSDRVIDYTRNNLIRIGLVRETDIDLKKQHGKRGPKPHVYAIGIADENDIVEAKIRYEELLKQDLRKSKAIQREKLRKTAEERRLKAEEKAHLKGILIQTLVTEFEGLYEKTEKPVPFQEIKQRVKSIGLENAFTYIDVAIALEEKGIQTGYYINGKLDPTANLPTEILKIRKSREVMR